MKGTKTVKHYLISLPFGALFMHCYVMSNDRNILEKASAKLLHEVETKLGPVQMPVVLSTGPLKPATVRYVRRVLTECYPDAKRRLDEATDFHMTIWGLSRDHPEHDKMLKIH